MNSAELSFKDALHLSMTQIMKKVPNAILLGQGVTDIKSIFGTTSNLVQEFGFERVIDTPIAEESVSGIALGAALNGCYPIMTHIRMDFSLLAMNQLLNHFAKYSYMYGGQCKPRGLIRMIVGRSWGQGSQHAQSLQSVFSHFPGVNVILPATSEDVINFYLYAALQQSGLVIAVEHRNLYDLKFLVQDSLINLSTDLDQVPWQPKVVQYGNHLTIIATSIMVIEAIRAANYLREVFDVHCEIINLGSASNIEDKLIRDSVSKTGRLIVCDTSWAPYGVAAEINRLICEYNPKILKSPTKSIGLAFTPCPTGKQLEDYFYPNIKLIVEEVLKMLSIEYTNSDLPKGVSYRDYYKEFRGPF